MDFLNSIFPKKKVLTQEQLQLQLLLKDLSLDELEKIAKEYISRNPKVMRKDQDGIFREERPNRNDLVQGVLYSVSLEGVVKVIPRLKGKY